VDIYHHMLYIYHSVRT